MRSPRAQEDRRSEPQKYHCKQPPTLAVHRLLEDAFSARGGGNLDDESSYHDGHGASDADAPTATGSERAREPEVYLSHRPPGPTSVAHTLKKNWAGTAPRGGGAPGLPAAASATWPTESAASRARGCVDRKSGSPPELSAAAQSSCLKLAFYMPEFGPCYPPPTARCARTLPRAG